MANQIPAIDLHFPVGGLHRRYARQRQPPYTTPDCLNVRAFDPLEGRERGGSRPGLVKSYTNIIGDVSVTGTISGTGTAIAASVSLITPTDAVAQCNGKIATFATSSNTYTIASVSAGNYITVTGDASGEAFDDGYSIACSDSANLITIVYNAGENQTYVAVASTIFASWMIGQKIKFATSGNEYTIMDLYATNTAIISGDQTSEWAVGNSVRAVSVQTCDGIPVYGGDNGRTLVTATASKFTTAHIGQTFVFDTSGAGYQIADYLDTDGKRISVEGDSTDEASGDTFTIPMGSPIRLLDTVMPIVLGASGRWLDSFEGAEADPAWPLLPLQSVWSQASWESYPPYIAWRGGVPYESSMAVSFVRPSGAASAVAVVRDAISDFDTTANYSLSMIAYPVYWYHNGKYRFYVAMDDTTPDVEADGTVIEYDFPTGTDGAYTITVTEYNSSTPTVKGTLSGSLGMVRPAHLRIEIDPDAAGDALVVYLQNTVMLSVTLGAAAGTRFGFGMLQDYARWSSPAGAAAYCYVDDFLFSYTSSATGERPKARLVASAYGDLHAENDTGQMPQITTELTLRSDVMLQAAQRAGKLFIADWGDVKAEGTDGTNAAAAVTFDSATYADWTAVSPVIDDDDDVLVISGAAGAGTAVEDGAYRIADGGVAAGVITTHASEGIAAAQDATACNFKILRGPKVYDPDAGTLALWLQEDDSGGTPKGIIPTGCPLITLYLDRMFLAGNPEHVWYASRIGNAYDWNYGASVWDPARAIAGTASDAGVLPDPLKAMFSATGINLIFACENSLWVMRGDPGLGAPINNLSHSIGIIDKAAWCHSPIGDVYFLSRDGLYVLPGGANVFPVPLSREKLPQELLNIDTSLYTVVLSYDLKHRDVHIYITPNTAGGGQHWLFNLQSQSFWPVTLPDSQEVFAATTHSLIGTGGRISMLGGRDGYIRHYSDDSPTDDGISIASHAVYGPFQLSPAADGEGILTELGATLAEASGDVTWSVHIGDTAEAAAAADAFDSGTWADGENYKTSPRARARNVILKLTNGDNRAWAVENVIARIKPAGKQRLF